MASNASVGGGRSRGSRRPCVRCKYLRQKCVDECIFAPYFPDIPGDDLNSKRFINMHKIYGASNVSKMLNELDPSLRQDAVNTLVYEAQFRLNDPVYGCVGYMYQLQQRLNLLFHDLHQQKTRLAAMINIDQEQQQHNIINSNHPTQSQTSDHMNFNLDQQYMLLNSGFNNPPLFLGDPPQPEQHYPQQIQQQEEYYQHPSQQVLELSQQQQVEAAVPVDAMTDEMIMRMENGRYEFQEEQDPTSGFQYY